MMNGRSVEHSFLGLAACWRGLRAVGACVLMLLLVACEREDALWSAVRNGRPDDVSELLSKGAAVDSRRSDGSTPLMQAARHNDIAVMRVLIEHGANADSGNGDGFNARDLAESAGAADAAALLRELGVPLNSLGPELLDAVADLKIDEVRKLLAQRVNTNFAFEDGVTALHRAVEGGQPEIVSLLLSAGADPNVRRKQDGASPLMLAAQNGRLDLVKQLTENGALPRLADLRSRTPIDYAEKAGNDSIVSFLRGQNCSTFEQNELLRDAIASKDLEAVKRAVGQGADPNHRVADGTSPLMLAAKAGDVSIIEFLLAAGADPLANRDDGKTVLGVARGSSEPVVRVIEAHGAKEESLPPAQPSNRGFRPQGKPKTSPFLAVAGNCALLGSVFSCYLIFGWLLFSGVLRSYSIWLRLNVYAISGWMFCVIVADYLRLWPAPFMISAPAVFWALLALLGAGRGVLLLRQGPHLQCEWKRVVLWGLLLVAACVPLFYQFYLPGMYNLGRYGYDQTRYLRTNHGLLHGGMLRLEHAGPGNENPVLPFLEYQKVNAQNLLDEVQGKKKPSREVKELLERSDSPTVDSEFAFIPRRAFSSLDAFWAAILALDVVQAYNLTSASHHLLLVNLAWLLALVFNLSAINALALGLIVVFGPISNIAISVDNRDQAFTMLCVLFLLALTFLEREHRSLLILSLAAIGLGYIEIAPVAVLTYLAVTVPKQSPWKWLHARFFELGGAGLLILPFILPLARLLYKQLKDSGQHGLKFPEQYGWRAGIPNYFSGFDLVTQGPAAQPLLYWGATVLGVVFLALLASAWWQGWRGRRFGAIAAAVLLAGLGVYWIIPKPAKEPDEEPKAKFYAAYKLTCVAWPLSLVLIAFALRRSSSAEDRTARRFRAAEGLTWAVSAGAAVCMLAKADLPGALSYPRGFNYRLEKRPELSPSIFLHARTNDPLRVRQVLDSLKPGERIGVLNSSKTGLAGVQFIVSKSNPAAGPDKREKGGSAGWRPYYLNEELWTAASRVDHVIIPTDSTDLARGQLYHSRRFLSFVLPKRIWFDEGQTLSSLWLPNHRPVYFVARLPHRPKSQDIAAVNGQPLEENQLYFGADGIGFALYSLNTDSFPSRLRAKFRIAQTLDPNAVYSFRIQAGPDPIGTFELSGNAPEFSVEIPLVARPFGELIVTSVEGRPAGEPIFRVGHFELLFDGTGRKTAEEAPAEAERSSDDGD